MQRVTLRDSGVTDKGALSLAAALWCSPTMTHVNLTNNEISDDGCDAFAEYLQAAPATLAVLSLELNPISTGMCTTQTMTRNCMAWASIDCGAALRSTDGVRVCAYLRTRIYV